MPDPAAKYSYYEQVRRHQRFNFGLHVVESFFGWYGWSSFESSMVLAIYVAMVLHRMGVENRFLVVLPSILTMLSWGLPQLVMAYVVQRFKTRKWLTVLACSADRAGMTGVWLSIALLPVIGPKWSLIMLFACKVVLIPLVGLSTSAWQDLLGRIILPGYRGRFFGLTQAIGPGAAALALYFVGRMLPEEGAEPGDYTWPLLVGVLVLWFTIILIALTRETPYPVPPPSRSFGEFAREMIRRYREDLPLRRYITTRMVGSFAAVYTLSLFNHRALREFNVPPGVIAMAFGVILQAPQVLIAPVAGWLGDRIGFRPLLIGGASFSTLAFAVGLTLPAWGSWAPAGFCVICFLIGLSWSVGMVGHWNMGYLFGPVEERPVVMALCYGLPSIVLVCAMAAGGILVDKVGDTPILVVATCCALACALCYAFYVPDPPGEGDDAAAGAGGDVGSPAPRDA